MLECHLDSNLPPDNLLAWHIQPDAHRIAAVVDGYARRRRPATLELDLFPDALRFGIAFIEALHFPQALEDKARSPEWVRSIQHRLARLQNRWEVNSEIASPVRKCFE